MNLLKIVDLVLKSILQFSFSSLKTSLIEVWKVRADRIVGKIDANPHLYYQSNEKIYHRFLLLLLICVDIKTKESKILNTKNLLDVLFDKTDSDDDIDNDDDASNSCAANE